MKMIDRRFVSRISHDSDVAGGVYIISVAARILAMHPQTLRKYELIIHLCEKNQSICNSVCQNKQIS